MKRFREWLHRFLSRFFPPSRKVRKHRFEYRMEMARKIVEIEENS